MNIATEQEILSHKGQKLNEWLEVKSIDGGSAYKFVCQYHYLGKALYLNICNYGCVIKGTESLVSVACFARTSNKYSTQSWFSQPDANNFLELVRLCTHPLLNKTNVSSFMLGGALHKMKVLNNQSIHKAKKEGREPTEEDWLCREVITLADSSRHNGTVYRCCNFKYYGLTDVKSDFYDTEGHKNPRVSTYALHGVWLPRTQKHRYAYIFDKSLKVNYQELPPPSYETLVPNCCKGTKKVFDYRWTEWWTCPICCGKLEKIEVPK